MLTSADPILVIITGGDTAERDGSLASASHLYDILRCKYQLVLVEIVQGKWTILQSGLAEVPAEALSLGKVPPLLKDMRSGGDIRPDAALISIHGRPGETGELQGYLDLLGIPYNGPRIFGAALAADKGRCKTFLQTVIGLTAPPQLRFAPGKLSLAALDAAGMAPPLVVKPNDLGSAIGVVSVHSEDGLQAALDQASALGCEILVEPFVEGMEVTVGAARFRSGSLAFEVAEVVRPQPETPQAPRLYTSRKETRLVIPARISAEVKAQLQRLTTAIGEALDIRGIYRADFIWDGTNLHFLEVNTLPGTAQDSVLIRQASASGYPPETLFPNMVEDVLAGAP